MLHSLQIMYTSFFSSSGNGCEEIALSTTCEYNWSCSDETAFPHVGQLAILKCPSIESSNISFRHFWCIGCLQGRKVTALTLVARYSKQMGQFWLKASFKHSWAVYRRLEHKIIAKKHAPSQKSVDKCCKCRNARIHLVFLFYTSYTYHNGRCLYQE